MRRLLFTIAASVFALAACHESAPGGTPGSGRASGGTVLNAPLDASFARWEKEGPTGDETHRQGLQTLAAAIRQRLQQKMPADVLFVCTHNSRRSHMAQLLGVAAARRNGLSTVRTFSGGTEATAFNPRAVAALQRVGFDIAAGGAAGGHERNPRHTVRFSRSAEPVEAYSKKLTDPPNPTSDFIVVMTCSQADAACPLVRGSVARIAIPYEDPKIADGTPEETARYDERTAQIGRDLAWVFAAASSP